MRRYGNKTSDNYMAFSFDVAILVLAADNQETNQCVVNFNHLAKATNNNHLGARASTCSIFKNYGQTPTLHEH